MEQRLSGTLLRPMSADPDAEALEASASSEAATVSPEPVFKYEGRVFKGDRSDFEDLAERFSEVSFGGGFSVAFTARWDGLQQWSRIIDFGNGPEDGNIFIANRSHTGALAFHIWVGPQEFRLTAPEVIKVGVSRRYMCTVTAGGHMKIFADGELVVENAKGGSLVPGVRKHLYIAKSCWDRDAPFKGEVSDLVVWNAAVNWDGSAIPESLAMEVAVPRSRAAPPPPKAGSSTERLTPAIAYPGRQFIGSPRDFDNLADKFPGVMLGGAFSIAFTCRFDSLNRWSRIIDFGDGEEAGNVFIANRNNSGGLAFHIWVNDRECRLTVENMIVEGEKHSFLCTVSSSGRMRMYKEGQMVGENRRGMPPALVPRGSLLVGKSNWSRDAPFHGEVSNIAVWNAVVDWNGCAVNEEYDSFTGQLYVVDLNTVDHRVENFQGRKWLERCIKDNLAISWCLQVQAPSEDYPEGYVASMQMAGEDVVLMLRLDPKKQYLPNCVMKALLKHEMVKITHEYSDRQKQMMQTLFDFTPGGLVDLVETAALKGYEATTLALLARCVGLTLRDAACDASSTDLQVEDSVTERQYLADRAFSTFAIYEPLKRMPDASWTNTRNDVVPWDAKGESGPNATSDPKSGKGETCPPVENVLVFDKAWEKHGIEEQNGFAFCTACGKGPMNTAKVVKGHLATQAHKKKMEQIADLALENADDTILNLGVKAAFPTELFQRGIAVTKAPPGFPPGLTFYKCALCNAGPFNALEVIESHMKSKRHQAAENLRADCKIEKDQSVVPKKPLDPFALVRWNFPDYVRECSGQLLCTLCNAQASVPQHLYSHLSGGNHAKKCRSHDLPEVVYSRDNLRLEKKGTGEAVVRSGFKMPKASSDSGSSPTDDEDEDEGDVPRSQPSQQPKEQQQPSLPDGWQEIMDQASGRAFFFCAATGVSQWERPGTTAAAASRAAETKPEAVPTTAGSSGGSTSSKAQPAPQDTRLPEGWHEGFDEASGCKYYHNAQGSQWERPQPAKGIAVAAAANTAVASRAVAGSSVDHRGQSHNLAQPATIADALPHLPALPKGWSEGFDKASGCTFYYSAEGVSQWERPSATPATPAAASLAALQVAGAEPAAGAVRQASAAASGGGGGLPTHGRNATGAGAAEPVEVAPTKGGGLPPGWRAEWDEASAGYYFADLETGITQWERPPPYVLGDWSRHIDQSNSAYWASHQLDLRFYELGSGPWSRKCGRGGGFYWSSGSELGSIRFFED